MKTENPTSMKPMLETNERIKEITTQATIITKEKRKISVTYTLKRFKETLKTLAQAKMLTTEEGKQLAEIYNTIYKREQGEELKL